MKSFARYIISFMVRILDGDESLQRSDASFYFILRCSGFSKSFVNPLYLDRCKLIASSCLKTFLIQVRSNFSIGPIGVPKICSFMNPFVEFDNFTIHFNEKEYECTPIEQDDRIVYQSILMAPIFI